MKNRSLITFSILFVLCSCKKLKVEEFQLTEDCKPTGINWADTLRQPDHGIHYVAVDTANCLLIVKYDDAKTSVAWINDYLEKKELHFVPKEISEDTVIFSNTPPDERENKILEQDLSEEQEELKIEPVVEKNSVDSIKEVQTEEKNIIVE